MGGDCVHVDVVYGATVTPLDQNNLPLDDEAERYVGEAENWKSRFYVHNRSFTVRDPDIQTSLSNHIWDLKDENIQFSITWQVLEKSKSFNPICLKCLLYAFLKPQKYSQNQTSQRLILAESIYLITFSSR